MKIMIAGSGAMGCRFGAALWEAGHRVLLLDGWREHVDAINVGGLRVSDERGDRTVPVPATGFPWAGGPSHLVIVFAKATQTASVAAAAAGAVGPRTLVLTLQNGLGNIEVLREYVPPGRLLAGTTTLGTELVGPGHIRALGSGETVLGALQPGPSEDAERIGLTLTGAHIPVRVTDDAFGAIWAKVAFNCVMNTLCAIASIPVSALGAYAGFDALASSILDEVSAVAAAEGVRVDTAASLRLMKAQFDPAASGGHLASTLQDLMNGRRTEIAHLNGAVARRAAKAGIAAPANALIARLIELLEATWPHRVNGVHAHPHPTEGARLRNSARYGVYCEIGLPSQIPDPRPPRPPRPPLVGQMRF
jgi:2-dehydropantoate 2-reductase